MSGLLLRLAGPLQSWGERSTFDVRDTAGFPTHSGLLGLLACVMGRRRGESLEDLAALTFTIRVDRPGTRIIDYQTAGGALPPSMKVPTADGKGRPAGKGTVQTWREYLADAVFVVAVQGPSEVLDQVRHALRYPHWQPYLGRRSCPPDQPLLLDVPVEDPVAELCTRVPLARRVGKDEETVPVDFIFPVERRDGVRSEIHDVPVAFTSVDRAYSPRPVWRSTLTLPAELGVSTWREYPEQLRKYLNGKGVACHSG
ncbi:type I-E CRISPR-associated protein Cas5/CasD [Saccharomonospora viridis]|uniref:CRISPR-associated protein Cas5 n=1 Tax=Saccharomonospora viridis (strain ATCC 15386 / DSM 43017 / JCM 3036 / CCUG 5913 / NBRC 12207 / NCIMB 9602 / P101) TaxID=471857 RepID=C7MTB0_SACVD|nr:type I-E CRISPR-associated protein Cas5/CasD [Saccharomonospora viridis]ACU96747.1 CRISPR-associated protein Cas5 [Saccharomonospora viridis DSM 43017]